MQDPLILSCTAVNAVLCCCALAQHTSHAFASAHTCTEAAFAMPCQESWALCVVAGALQDD